MPRDGGWSGLASRGGAQPAREVPSERGGQSNLVEFIAAARLLTPVCWMRGEGATELSVVRISDVWGCDFGFAVLASAQDVKS